MPENRTHPVNRSPKEDSSQINEHLNTMPIDKLTDALADMWDAADDFTYSASEMDACLEEIEQTEVAPEFDVDASLNRSSKSIHVWSNAHLAHLKKQTQHLSMETFYCRRYCCFGCTGQLGNCASRWY